ncbi:major facilitator superfamily domain-containing protein [Lactarius pseudohatsudake]|nr:major facilitator superfamily domain-containing protein [Lactarius pseudohatsudake]
MPSNVPSTCSVDFQVPAPLRDAEKGDDSAAKTASESLDIEHVHVVDDPRKWSNMRKTGTLCMIICASIVAGLSISIFNPAIKQIETDLRTTSGKFSLVLSIFIVFQGSAPLLWAAISEIKGRKLVYVVSLAIAMVGYIVAAEAKSIGVFIGMRAIQGVGTGSVLAIGAATLADIYEPCERGTKLGIAYTAPLLGPSIGPILGGVLTQAFSWRACFWLQAAYLGVSLVIFVFFFRDTFRKERSLTYQRVLASRRSAASKRSSVVPDPAHESDTKSKGEAVVTVGEASCPAATVMVASPQAGAEIALSFKDVNPFPPLFLVLKRRNNIATLFPSGIPLFRALGLFFAFSYNITYTCSRTLGDHYNYDALKIGLVLLSFGVGSVLGSVLGGRWSDRVLRRLTSANGGHRLPEACHPFTKLAMVFLPLSVVAYAWLAQERVHVASLCTALFFIGFFSVWIYSSTLAYIVDANPGRSSAAVATNSWFRGAAAFVFTEAAVPLQDSMGDGGLYTLWAGILVLSELMLLLVLRRGGAWREAAEECEKPQS